MEANRDLGLVTHSMPLGMHSTQLVVCSMGPGGGLGWAAPLLGELAGPEGAVADALEEAAGGSSVYFDAMQVQSKFAHAEDFGVVGNYNTSNAAKFVDAMSTHI